MKKNKTVFSELYDWVTSLAYSLIVIILIFTFLVRTSVVSGPSMNPTLYNGDMLLISRFLYTPKNGDIVVITKPYSSNQPIIKRIIATEGQTVYIDFEQGIVSVDGEMIDEDYLNSPTNVSFDVEFPVTVPKGCVFCLGDNRNDSYDSRASEIGMIDNRYILGKVLYRILPNSGKV